MAIKLIPAGEQTCWGLMFIIMCCSLLAGCNSNSSTNPLPVSQPEPDDAVENDQPRGLDIQSEPFGTTKQGAEITQYLLTNSNGVSVGLINLGASITSVYTPDRDGQIDNIALQFPDLSGYETNSPYFGGICGRYANRIAGGKFRIGETEFKLATNNGSHHLHGGTVGFNKRVWLGKEVKSAESVGVEFTLVSDDGEEGYPGMLTSKVTYLLNEQNELKIEYFATTDKTTVVNLTNHCYWNLAGAQSGTMLEQLLTLNSEEYLPVDETLIPTGKPATVAETIMDFRQPHTIGERIAQVSGGGYDHCYLIRGSNPKEPVLAAKVEDPTTGRVMEIFTTEPAVQFYTGIHLDGSDAVNGYPQYAGFCLECQHYPDSPNRPEYPSTELEPGTVYRQITIHRFSIAKATDGNLQPPDQK